MEDEGGRAKGCAARSGSFSSQPVKDKGWTTGHHLLGGRIKAKSGKERKIKTRGNSKTGKALQKGKQPTRRGSQVADSPSQLSGTSGVLRSFTQREKVTEQEDFSIGRKNMDAVETSHLHRGAKKKRQKVGTKETERASKKWAAGD